MDSIKIDDGLKHIAITDTNGKPRGEIVFSPEDVGFVERLEKILADMDTLSKDFQTRAKEVSESEKPKAEQDSALLQMTKQFHVVMREKIDYLLGPGTSEMAFGELYTFRAVESFLNGLSSLIVPVRAEKVAKYLPPTNGHKKPKKPRARK